MRNTLARFSVLVWLTTLAACSAPVEPALDAAGGDVTADVVIDWGPAECDPLMPQRCALPWPSSFFLSPDEGRVTGVTLSFGATSLPANRDGTYVNPEPWKRLDGYGVGTPIIMYFPDLDASTLPDETELAETMEPDSPIFLYAAKDGVLTRIPCWAELDMQTDEILGRALFIRPAVILEPATRYIVGLRGLMRQSGAAVVPSAAFDALRRGDTAGTPMEPRQARFDEIFQLLTAEGIDVDELTLTWDFVTASHEALHGAMVYMRDTAFAEVGAKGPVLTVTDQAPDEPSKPGFEPYAKEDSPHIAIQLRGTMEVPHFLEAVEVPGGNTAWGFHDPVDGLPQINGTRQAEFRIRIPWSALDGTPHGIIMHGHGQSGTHEQIQTDFYDEIANTEDFVIIGCNMIGMSEEDVPALSSLIYDLSFFHTLSDRIHQGMVEHLLLIRAVRERLGAVPELSEVDIQMDPENVYYAGISLGGIYGGTLMALSQDIVRGHLGVPGNNYGLLVRRSKNFYEFFVLLHIAYPDFVEKAILLGAVQSLWDQVDPVSYYRHIKHEPLPNTPSHEVLLVSATADYQVALISNEITVRSDLGVVLLPDYGKDVPLVDVTPYPHVGSGLVNYSFGNPWPAPGPIPPKDEVGDPHEKPRSLEWHNAQMLHFFRTGEIIDTCGGDGCNPD